MEYNKTKADLYSNYSNIDIFLCTALLALYSFKIQIVGFNDY